MVLASSTGRLADKGSNPSPNSHVCLLLSCSTSPTEYSPPTSLFLHRPCASAKKRIISDASIFDLKIQCYLLRKARLDDCEVYVSGSVSYNLLLTWRHSLSQLDLSKDRGGTNHFAVVQTKRREIVSREKIRDQTPRLGIAHTLFAVFLPFQAQLLLQSSSYNALVSIASTVIIIIHQ